jgi:hypothetical protein
VFLVARWFMERGGQRSGEACSRGMRWPLLVSFVSFGWMCGCWMVIRVQTEGGLSRRRFRGRETERGVIMSRD